MSFELFRRSDLGRQVWPASDGSLWVWAFCDLKMVSVSPEPHSCNCFCPGRCRWSLLCATRQATPMAMDARKPEACQKHYIASCYSLASMACIMREIINENNGSVRCQIPWPFFSRELCRKAHTVGTNLKGGSEDFQRKRRAKRRK